MSWAEGAPHYGQCPRLLRCPPEECFDDGEPCLVHTQLAQARALRDAAREQSTAGGQP